MVETKLVRGPDPPPGLIEVRIPKAVLLLTLREYQDGLRRGKSYRRRAALARRLATNGMSPVPTSRPGGDRST